MNKIVVNIEGMHCMGCALGIEEEVEKLDFVKSVHVDFQNKQAEIIYEEGKLEIEKIEQTIEKLGFKVINWEE